MCKKRRFKFNAPQNTNGSNLFDNTPTSLCESVVSKSKRKKKNVMSAGTKVSSLSIQFSMCDTTESSIVLPKKQVIQRSAIDRRTSSLFAKNESSQMSHTFPPAHSQSLNTYTDPESSVVLNKKKSTLKGCKQFSTTNLFDSEPNSVCESLIETQPKRKRFRDDLTCQPSLLNDLSEFSNDCVENEEKLSRKPLASFADKENVDINFDGTVSSISDSITEKQGGGFLHTFRKAKNSTVNASVDIFCHPEGLSDDFESSSAFEESDKGM